MPSDERRQPARARAGMILPRSNEPNRSIGQALRRPLLAWCLRQGIIAGLGTDHLTASINSLEDISPYRLTSIGRRMCLNLDLDVQSQQELVRQVESDWDLLIDIADWLVHDMLNSLRSDQRHRVCDASATLAYRSDAYRVGQRVRELIQLFDDSGSAWAVDCDGCGLIERVSREERDTYDAATEKDDAATEYLRAGWKAAWGVPPSSDLAHENAVNALEALFRPVVTPKEPDATLGKIVSCLEDKPSKWRARLEDRRSPEGGRRTDDAGVRFVANALRTVFQSDHRHAAAEGSPPHTEEDGRDAITIAVAIIALQRRKFLKRVDAPE